MLKFTIKRILTGILALFVLATVTFFLVRAIPGSPFLNAGASSRTVEAIEEEYGLNAPPAEQYLTYLGNLLRGDPGVSYVEPDTSVAEIIGRTWPVTARLGILAFLTAVLLGTGLGILRASSERRAVREAVSAAGMMASGIPNFAAAILLLLLFCVKLKWLPAAGLTTPAHYVLPVAALALYPTAVISRLVGNTLASELGKQYVLFARAKGLGRRRILFTHALKNAWIPVLNYAGPASAFLLTGSFAVESVFTIPGMGREFVGSITNRDYTLILGLTVFMGAVVITVNLATDLLCAWLDPRVSAEYRGEQAGRGGRSVSGRRKKERRI